MYQKGHAPRRKYMTEPDLSTPLRSKPRVCAGSELGSCRAPEPAGSKPSVGNIPPTLPTAGLVSALAFSGTATLALAVFGAGGRVLVPVDVSLS